MKLCPSVTFNTQIAPVCVHTNNGSEISDYAMREGDSSPRCRVMGWGETSSGGNYDDA